MGPDLLLDSRLALVHRADGWLAVADLHLGYALERRRRGGLFPAYGDDELRRRLLALLEDHQPRTLILLGDIIDGAAAPEPGLELLRELAARPGLELVALRGNHDRALDRAAGAGGGGDSAESAAGVSLARVHRQGRFVFHHGDPAGARAAALVLAEAGPGAIEVSGHLHPAAVLRDGAGTKLKLPALWRRPAAEGGVRERLVLPAFSPWSAGSPPEGVMRPGRGGGRRSGGAGRPRRRGAGADPPAQDQSPAPESAGELWVCAPGRVFPLGPRG